jgi:membrane protease YdiL (CAAX protease family)
LKNVIPEPTKDLHTGEVAVGTPTSARSTALTAHASRVRSLWRWLALAAILLAGNVANALSWHFAIPINTGAFSIALAVGLYVTPGLAEWLRSRMAEMAWRPRWRPTALALGAGLALAVPSVLFFAVAQAHGGIGYSPIAALPLRSLLTRELIEIPLLTAVLEELVFRQYLFRAFAQRTMLATVLINAGIFTLWHLVVTARTVLATSFAGSPLLLAGAYVGSLATIFVAGVVFALVRWRTRSFAYSALTHWVVLGLTTLAVWAL